MYKLCFPLSTALAKATKLASEEYNKDDEIEEIKSKFLEAMDDDFNTSLAISYLYETIPYESSPQERRYWAIFRLQQSRL